MENESQIRSFLKKDYKEYCDDCIAELTGISPRQQVNQICNKSDSISSNNKGICSYCGKTKKTRFVIDINNPPKVFFEALSWPNSYTNTAMVHSQDLIETEKKLKKILTDDFESNLYFKLKEFAAYVCSKSAISKFDSFATNSFIQTEENYKKEIWDIANEGLKHIKAITEFGSGEIIRTLITECIEIQGNNLLQWTAKQGPESRVHARLFEILESRENLKELEETIWKFYFSDEQPEMYFFDAFTTMVNKKYSLIAYLYFLKDKSKYLPIATKTFDQFFAETKIDLITTQKCSWENYYSYISVVKFIRSFLRENLDSDATLIDAHSFICILEKQYKRDLENKNYSVPKKIELKEKDRETVVKARTGQGLYRKYLLEKWNNSSSISDYANPTFLMASHVKPWRDCDIHECIDPGNGLLLTPTYDYLFDQGYISFSDNGEIIISGQLSDTDIREMNITNNIRLKAVSSKLSEYLEYHRENIFRE